MIKLLSIVIIAVLFPLYGIAYTYIITRILQVVPSHGAFDKYWIASVIALAGAISALFIYIKSNHKEHIKQLREQHEDYKQLVQKNTEGFFAVHSSMEKQASNTKDLEYTLNSIRAWLNETMFKK